MQWLWVHTILQRGLNEGTTLMYITVELFFIFYLFIHTAVHALVSGATYMHYFIIIYIIIFYIIIYL